MPEASQIRASGPNVDNLTRSRLHGKYAHRFAGLHNDTSVQMPPSSMTGFIDESIHAGADLYAIGVVLADPRRSEEVRRHLVRLVPAARPPHWSQEDTETRTALVDTIAALPMRARVYGCRFESPRRQEAARARALTWLVQELPVEVRHIVVAAREAAQDRRDRRVPGGLGGRPPRFEYEHAPYSKEPLLWVADTVVSCTAKQLACGDDPRTGRLTPLLEAVGCEAQR